MNSILKIICIVIGMIIGICGGRYLLHRPLKIEFKISIGNRIIAALWMFIIITIAIMGEYLLNSYNLKCFPRDKWWLKVLSSAIDGGLLITLFLPTSSYIFGKFIKSWNLDLCLEYNVTTVKIYYSIAIIFDCIWLLVIAWPGIVHNDPEMQSVINRVIIWTLSVIGTWFGMGFHCEGTINEELNNIRKEMRDTKAIVKYNLPYILTFIISSCFLAVQAIDQTIADIIWQTFLFGALGMVFVILILILYTKPSKKRSYRNLEKAIKNIKEKAIVSEQYGEIVYSLINTKSKMVLVIHEKKVIWVGHESEIAECFGKKTLEITEFPYEECKKYIEQIEKRRKNCLDQGRRSCKEERREQLEKQN